MHNNRSMHPRALLSVVAVCLPALLIGCEVDPEAAAKAEQRTRVERGEYLVTTGACDDCHTPWVMGEQGPEPDMTRRLSGHPASFVITEAPVFDTPEWAWAGSPTNTAFAGPWGVSFAANLTPDEETGLGIWTEEQFIQSMRTGKHWGVDRPILPPMPWQAYAKMTDEDLASMFAYLQTIPAHNNPVPRPLPPAAATPDDSPAGE